MYPPKHHQENNNAKLIEVIKHFPLATIISVSDNQPIITHAPLIYKDGLLIGHIDKQNPHAHLLKNEKEVTLIFSGPQCYISPSIYSTEQLPTWNYIKVHIKGTVTEIIEIEKIKESMIEMTQYLEHDNAFILDKHNDKMAQFVNYVSAFKITPTHWEGKFKLSQDKNPEDINSAKQTLKNANKKDIDNFINQLF